MGIQKKKKKTTNNTSSKDNIGWSEIKEIIKSILVAERTISFNQYINIARSIVGISVILFSLYLLASFTYFIFDEGKDYSAVYHSEFITETTAQEVDDLLDSRITSTSEEIGASKEESEIKVGNPGSVVGVKLSDYFINRLFGLPSIIIVYMLFMVGLRFLGEIHRFYILLFQSLLLMVGLSVVLGYFTKPIIETYHLLPGGVFGLYINAYISGYIGWLGSLFIVIPLTLVIVLVALRFSAPAFITIRNQIGKNLNKFRKRRATTEELESEEESNYEYDDYEDENYNDIQPDDIQPDNIRSINSRPNSENIDSDNIGNGNGNTSSTEEFAEEPIIKVGSTIDLSNNIANNISNNRSETNNREVEKPQLIIEKLTEVETVEKLDHDNSDYDPTLDLSGYKFPTLDLLKDYGDTSNPVSDTELQQNTDTIIRTLKDYNISIINIKATSGPTVTLYEIIPAPGVRINKIKNLEDDIALSLSALGIRIIAPIPGKGTVGIEVPNMKPKMVPMKDIISSKEFATTKFELPLALGKTISNEPFIIDLAKMPHILVAGATGQGKSVGINAIIASLLYKKHPSQLKFVLIDPKKVELSLYSIIENHFLAKMPDEDEPIITDVQKVKNTLNSVCVEMDNRYDLLKNAGARNLLEYNKKFIERRLNPEKGHRYMPYIVVIIDEFADLIMTAGKEIETPIARIAQLARAVGIHMIIATQRPSANIITGPIKANFPARVAFKVASMIDSRTILDTPGANQLVGKGDMLVMTGNEMTRVQCAFIDTPEVDAISEFIGAQRGYPTALLLPEFQDEESESSGADLSQRDAMFDEAARHVVMNQSGSTSAIQRRFSIGYNRAGRIMDQLEAAGIVSPGVGSKPRQVLIQDEYTLEQLLNSL